MANKKKTAKAGDEGFMTTAAQKIGSTLGQLAVKAGIVAVPPPAARKKPAVKKKATAARKNTVPKKRAVPVKKKTSLKPR